MPEYIQYHTEERISYIILNRPEKRNAFHPDLVTELKQAFRSEIDNTEWKVKSYDINSWEMTTKKGECFTNYQVKAKFERRTSLSPEAVLEDFIKEALNYSPNYKTFERKKKSNPVMVEISIPDLHYGLLAWGRETLDADYDIKISEAMFFKALEYLLLSIKGYNVERFLFPIGNDFFNVNSALNTTFKGTPQSEDDRWKKCFSNAWKMLVKAIEYMVQVADVDILIVPGNHDFERSYYLGEVLYS